MKFDSQITDIKNRLQNASRVLVILPAQVNVDKLASGLSLYLSLKAAGKNVSIVSEATPLVAHGSLFGVGDIKSQIPAGSGNFMVHLDGVADSNATDPLKKVPTLEKLDWYSTGSTLNLVFHTVPGQRFEPTKLSSSFENSSFDLIFVIGAASVAELGNLYIQNVGVFSQTQMVNIDNNGVNTNFGGLNLVGTTSATISEIISEVISGSSMPMDLDIATNILSGIYDATNNLTGVVDAETFLAISKAMQSGGTIPGQQSVVSSKQSAEITPQPQVIIEETPPVSDSALSQNPFLAQFDQATFQAPEVSVQTPSQNVSDSSSIPQTPANQESAQSSGFDLRQVFQIPQVSEQTLVDVQPQINVSLPTSQSNASSPTSESNSAGANAASPEERPTGEYVSSPSPEMDSQPTPDWLVPKIFKGGNLG